MFVKKIKCFDDDSGEADLIISDGTYDLLCCCFPFENKTIENLKIKRIESLFCDNIIRVDTNEYLILKQQDGYYSYHLRGKILDFNERTVNIGNIIIKLDEPFPGDLINGDFVEFDVIRLDVSI